MRTCFTITAALCISSASGFQNGAGRPTQQYNDRSTSDRRSTSAREMKSSKSMEEDRTRTGRRIQARSQITSLSVATFQGAAESLPRSSSSLIPQLKNIPKNIELGSGNLDAIGKVLSASLLITGNTVGSSMFVLPEAVGGVGMVWGSGIFFGECSVFSLPFVFVPGYRLQHL